MTLVTSSEYIYSLCTGADTMHEQLYIEGILKKIKCEKSFLLDLLLKK